MNDVPEHIRLAAERIRIVGLATQGKEAFEGATDEEVAQARIEYGRMQANAAETQRIKKSETRLREGNDDNQTP